jgi:hypothetical protein
MMSETSFVFYNWFLFIWGAIGFLFISVVSIREVIQQFKSVNEVPVTISENDDSKTL